MSPEGMYGAPMGIVSGGAEGLLTLEVSPDGRVDRVSLVVGPLEGEVAATIGLDIDALRDELSARYRRPR